MGRILTEYFAPTKVIFGENAENSVALEIEKLQAKNVLIHYGTDRIKKDGLFDKVTTLLKDKGIKYSELSGVLPNPRLSLVYKGIELCKKENIDLVLAIGGGSVIDSAKAICYGAKLDEDVWNLYEGLQTPIDSLPLGVILTHAAAGSEMSSSSVITDDRENKKRGYNNDLSRAKFALLNPCLTYSLPPYQTASAVVDIMMHTIERYFINEETLTLTDNLALSLIKTVMKAGKVALQNPKDYSARADLMWASSLSHNGLMALGNLHRGDWAPHQLEHELSGFYDVAHGAGLSAIWSSWARYVVINNPQRFANFGYGVFDIKPSTDVIGDANKAINLVEEYFISIGMPVRLYELLPDEKLTKEDIEKLAESATYFGKRTLGNIKVLQKQDMINIYTMANI